MSNWEEAMGLKTPIKKKEEIRQTLKNQVQSIDPVLVQEAKDKKGIADFKKPSPCSIY